MVFGFSYPLLTLVSSHAKTTSLFQQNNHVFATSLKRRGHLLFPTTLAPYAHLPRAQVPGSAGEQSRFQIMGLLRRTEQERGSQ